MEDRQKNSLYDPRFEHDACGIGAVVDLKGGRSHKTVSDALSIVEKLRHRAGRDASGETGDGVGILLQVPHELFAAEAEARGLTLGGERDYGVGMFFLPRDRIRRSRCMKLFEILLGKEGMEPLFWRDVPTRPEILGQKALACMPYIAQIFVRRPGGVAPGLNFDRRLYIVRREFEQSVSDAYIASLSCRTIVYKGMFLVEQLRRFYPDLENSLCRSALALVHSRFSTNTFPSWERAHPNRLILHNGEINTIRGNIDRMLAREETMYSRLLAEDMDKVLPVVNSSGSDSAMLDNTLEFLMFSGMDLPLAVMVTIPEPWNGKRDMSRERRDMYHYYATMMEPWDGPAAILFSDGDSVGAVLDRNGLRPLRYYLTADRRLILSSEVGVMDIPPEQIAKRSRLEPGKILLADVVDGRVRLDDEIKEAYSRYYPFGEWLDSELIKLSELPTAKKRLEETSQPLRDRLYKAFGWSYEEIKSSVLAMARTGTEPTEAMGADTPLAVLSDKHQPLFNYFKQMFAQVTNPPIDSLREKTVVDTTIYVGTDGNLLEAQAANCRVLELAGPILSGMELMKIKALDKPGLKSAVISLLYYKNTSLERALDALFVSCDKAYRAGANIMILSDRGVDENHTAIPSLLAVSALEQYLVRTKKRTAVSVILESAEPRSVHHFAALLGYGATAVNPYLAHECIGEMIGMGLLDRDYYAAVDAYDRAVLDGVVKIASKMGISTIQSYRSAQIFEAVGINRDVMERYFGGTVSRVGGVGMAEIAEAVILQHDMGFDPMGLPIDPATDSQGLHFLRSGMGAEEHLWDPMTILTLQSAVKSGSYDEYKEYARLSLHESTPCSLRSLLEFNTAGATPIPIEEVEPEGEIMKRFKTGAMSYGSISQEAHECLALAMNAIGGKSNSGEGGESRDRLGTNRNSAVKQVASGRFGVTSEYLVSAEEIQIKMAQGAKPGEGGHLPGSKVWPWIARTRCSTPGVSLISPPPHHDIYSIEDLAQLIYDLKCANRYAAISVKLVSEAGVGTIAAGVAKAGAQTVLISGYDGGTGAAPQNSIYNAGLPWELGLAEAHQTLMKNGLRSRVRLEVDGKLMNGRDVAVACMLGAEEFGFATAPLVALGCRMMRLCSRDTCPLGIATQNPALRKNFGGRPEYVVNYMRFVARELREIMASLGVRTVDGLVGRTELLRRRETEDGRGSLVDLSALLAPSGDGPSRFDKEALPDFELENTLDQRVFMKLLEGKKNTASVKVCCTDRAIGTLFGAELTRRFGGSLPENSYVIKCTGGAGQSFGAFIPAGLSLELEGDSNDYLGKGLSGGRISVRPPKLGGGEGEDVIIGNVALYGATGGSAFIRGRAGERFCVRNSGAVAVVEGVGEHGCEYMTGGRVVILGPTGRNFAAGMSGGTAYVLDTAHDLYLRVNKDMVDICPVSESHDIAELQELLSRHLEATGSPKAGELLAGFPERAGDFKKVVPRDYTTMAGRIARYEARGIARDEAELMAFEEGGL
ncbi:MAG: glutamate synthase large subunit [Oscillospiraceae bacterium]|nr:glutamate synthase large subunit [Oscillospiraceae bacterium]